MFERCDERTRTVVDAATGEARRRGHRWLGTEHVLLALARRRDDALPPDVAALLPGAEAIAAALEAEAAPGRRDSELLASVGVDLERVRAAVRRTFGEEAVRRLRRPVHQPWQPWRRPARRCSSILVDELSMAPRLKRSFEIALRHAEGRGLPSIDPVSVLLGMLEMEDATSNKLLRSLGLDPSALASAVARHDP